MEFEQLIRERYSVRRYSPVPVEEEKLHKILEAARLAPTGHNSQPQRVYVIRSEEGIRKIRGLCRCAFDAPVVLMVTFNREEQWKNDLEPGQASGMEDASIAATQMMLEAWNLGIGSCWVNWIPYTKVKEAFGIPEEEELVLIMPIGYPAEGSHPSRIHEESKPLDDLVRYC